MSLPFQVSKLPWAGSGRIGCKTSRYAPTPSFGSVFIQHDHFQPWRLLYFHLFTALLAGRALRRARRTSRSAPVCRRPRFALADVSALEGLRGLSG